MSRLYEVLTGATDEQRRRGAVPPRVTQPELISLDEPPPELIKTAQGLSEVTAAEIEETVDREEASSVTMRASPASRLIALTNPNSLGAEKFRVLVTRLDHLRKQRPLKSLQVISSVIAEGKTVLAGNLAVTLAKYLGDRTLLIGGDLRRPTLGSLFGLNELRGLSDWWFGQDDEIAHFLYELDEMPLWFMPAGKPCERPSEILQSARLTRAFAQLTAWFDWIVVDSTPMVPIVDANLWSRLVDGALLVVREGVTPVKALKRGLQALDHPKLIGVVVNEASDFDQAGYEGQYHHAVEQAQRRPPKDG